MKKPIDMFLEDIAVPLMAIRTVAKENKDFKVADMLRDYLLEKWKFKVIDTQTSCSGYFIEE
jgi:cysteinyl-tRNA synthetase